MTGDAPSPDRKDELAALLALALDGSAPNPLKVKLMAALCLKRQDADLELLLASITIMT